MTTREKIIARPCPFCGSTNIVVSTEEHFLATFDRGKDDYGCLTVSCEDCDNNMYLHKVAVRGNVAESNANNYQEGRAKLITKWNTRYNPLANDSEKSLRALWAIYQTVSEALVNVNFKGGENA